MFPEPDILGRRALFEEQHYRFHACACEHAAGQIEYRVQVAGFQQQLPQTDGCVVGIAQEGVFDHHPGFSARFQDFDEVLQENILKTAGQVQEYEITSVFANGKEAALHLMHTNFFL